MMMVSCKEMMKYSLVAALCLTALLVISRKQFIPPRKPTLTNSNLGSEKVHYMRGIRRNIQPKISSRFGYVLASNYFDQITDASKNILSLQCWARAVSTALKVVEPFVHRESGFGVSLRSRSNISSQMAEKAVDGSNMLRLRDVLNLESWEEQLRGKSYSSFESWKIFLKSAPRNLIIVGKPCREPERNSCNDHFTTVSSHFAKEHSFDIVRTVHLKNILHSFDGFRNIVYGDHKPEESVVLFNSWGGTVPQLTKGRIAMSDNQPCIRNSLPNFLLESSPKIVEDSRRYLDQYMPNSDSDYISVMLRTEHFGINHNFREIKSQEEKVLLYSSCVQGIIDEVRTMQELHKTKGVFLTVDCRKYGSRELKDSSDQSLLDTVVEILFRRLQSYGMKLSLQEWDDSLDEVSSFRVPGYVALLQKNLAASGGCLVTAGGGTFQKSAQTLYKSIHKSHNITSQCYKVIQEC